MVSHTTEIMRITYEYSLIFPPRPDTHKAKQRSIFERYSLANVTRPEIDLHTMEALWAFNMVRRTSRAASMRG